ncbi:MAG TPA: hypothetical protein VFA33_06275 [Bryobacteraceae bacterium]|nr:hypothetical protein [Bryobacteraceae bacterium]
MRPRAQLEKSIVSQIMAKLKKVPGLVIRKRHGTVMGMAGDPDLYGSYRGRHFEIEVKRPFDSKSELTTLQAERGREWSVEGQAIYGVARSAEEAFAILGIPYSARQPESYWLCGGCRGYTWRGSEAPARCPRCGHRHFEEQKQGAQHG